MANRIHIFFLLIVFSAGRAAAQSTSAPVTDNEKRLASIEERLARLEGILARLAEKVFSENERHQIAASAGAVKSLETEVRSLAGDQKSVAAGTGIASETQQSSVTAATSSKDASVEISSMPYAGYMELHLNHDDVNPTTLDFHRFVLLFGHGFGDRIRFWSELELEHAFVEGREESGEVALEQAYLDVLLHPKLNFRAGMLLSPVGIINERHEPPSFNGVERPFVDTFIVPSTWFGSGAGIVGDVGRGFAYKAYTMVSLDAARFSAEEGFRGGRQNGFLENAKKMAFVGRLEHRGFPGLKLGTSFWTGETGFNLQGIRGRARILEFDGRYRKSRFDGRAQFAVTHLNDAAQINRALRLRTGINPNIARSMRGFYLEAAAHLFPLRFKHDLVSFYRYENFDTQYRMPAGFLPLKQFDRSAHVVGVTYYPYPDIAFKFDYNFMRSASEVFKPRNAWNLGLGWWF